MKKLEYLNIETIIYELTVDDLLAMILGLEIWINI